MRAEAHLVDAARLGDRGAIVRLLSVCQPDLKRFARRGSAVDEGISGAAAVSPEAVSA